MMKYFSFRRLIPVAHLVVFLTINYLLVLGQVPEKNQIPATFASAALMSMTIIVILAARVPIIDRLMVGPGRSYRLHRVLGYYSIGFIIIHWLLATPKGPGLMPELVPSATLSVKYASILVVALVIISALKIIPYHIWKKTHYLMAPIYLIAIFHTFFSKTPVAFGSVLWWVLVFMSLIGIMALAWTVIRHFLPSKMYRVTEILRIKQGLDIRIKAINPETKAIWKPGQYATLSFQSAGLREPHPFTIASSMRSSEQMRVVIGNRGDYTAKLMHQLNIGDQVRIHEVTGDFMPQYAADRYRRQIWVAGGIGITPFLAAIDAMAPDDGLAIDLIYCYRSLEHAFDVEALVNHADRLPQLRVHFLGEDVAGRMNAHTLPNICSDGWAKSDLYVCGPEPLIDIACHSWREHGGKGSIHVELFDFRKPVELPAFSKAPRAQNDEANFSNTDNIKSFG